MEQETELEKAVRKTVEETTQQIDFFEDFNNLKESIGTLTKNAQGFGYSYLELVKLLDTVEPKIKENNFILLSTTRRTDAVIKRSDSAVIIHKDKDGNPTLTSRREYESPCYEVHSELIHTSGQVLSCDLPLYVDDIDPQSLGSAITYMRRYSLFVLLGIKTQDDDGAKASAKDKTKHYLKEPLPSDPNEIADFLVKQERPANYYGDLKARQYEIDPKLYKQLVKIIYPD
ncbi:MAG: ERF family protein [Acutalibacteraceae bacterium]|nr:ERF family protein [Acutalibacteraceae bacterium]